MPQIPEYPENSTPASVDQLIGIINASDPQNWAVNRFPINGILAEVNVKINEIVTALQASEIYPGEIVFTTEGDSFAPVIVLSGEATVEWTFSDSSTSNSLAPSVSFTSAGTRRQRLKVTPWDALYRINLGYAGADGGPATDEAGNTFEHVAAQPVTAITNLSLVKDTLVYLCGCGCPITAVEVQDFTALYGIEFYGCSSLISANIHGTANLRRACFENSPVGFLDFTESPLMEDVRGSNCDLTEIRWGTTGQYLWHMCVRENSATLDPATWPPMNQFPVLRDMWISGNGLTGDMVANSTEVGSAWLYNNDFSSIDMSNTGAESITAQNNSSCTAITIDGCTTLSTLDASGCALTQLNVDYLLATLDANGLSNGTVDLSGGTNASPSNDGLTSIANLEGKGWTCTHNAPDLTVPTLISATVGPDGQTWTFIFDEPVNIGAGGSGGFAVTMTTAGAISLTYSSGAGTSTLVYTGDVAVGADDTVSSGLDYTQPGDGLEDNAGNDLATFTGAAVTNNVGAVNRLDYTTSDGDPSISIQTDQTATITWHFADGSEEVYTDAAAGTHTPTTTDTGLTGEQSQYVIVDPPEAVYRINRASTNLLDVDGCGNFPNLDYIYFYPWTMARHLDLTDCSMLREVHCLDSGSMASAEVDQMVQQWAAALSGYGDGTISGHMYCPSNRTSASDAARQTIIDKGISWSSG